MSMSKRSRSTYQTAINQDHSGLSAQLRFSASSSPSPKSRDKGIFRESPSSRLLTKLPRSRYLSVARARLPEVSLFSDFLIYLRIKNVIIIIVREQHTPHPSFVSFYKDACVSISDYVASTVTLLFLWQMCVTFQHSWWLRWYLFLKQLWFVCVTSVLLTLTHRAILWKIMHSSLACNC